MTDGLLDRMTEAKVNDLYWHLRGVESDGFLHGDERDLLIALARFRRLAKLDTDPLHPRYG